MLSLDKIILYGRTPPGYPGPMQANGHTRRTTGEPPADHSRLTVAQAAQEIGITEGAVRSRIKRGTLPIVKEGGTVYVVWSSSGTSAANQTPHTGEPSDQPQANELVESLREQIEYLRGQLDQEREAGRRKDHLLAAALDRIPAIEAPETATPEDGPREAPKRPATADNGAGRGNVPEDAEAPVEERRESRSWWRRLVGGG